VASIAAIIVYIAHNTILEKYRQFINRQIPKSAIETFLKLQSQFITDSSKSEGNSTSEME